MQRIMKRRSMKALSFITVLFLVLTMTVPTWGLTWQEGCYEGTAGGYGGDLTVTVTVGADGKISEVIVGENRETPDRLESAKAVISKILETQSLEVDTVSGATVTSKAIIAATGDALSKGGATIYLNGVSGSDENNGDASDQAVKTFEKAKELMGNKAGKISIAGTVTVSGTESWELPKGIVLERSDEFTGALVQVDANGELSLREIVIDGKNIAAQSAAIVVDDNGILNIGEGTVIQNNKNSARFGAGGAVKTVGDVNMTGGCICSNSANEGGGIAVEKNSFRDGTTPCLNLSGGEIINNQAPSGGGVYSWFGEILMSGGLISGNTATSGGGIGFWGTMWGGTGTFTGGEITGNTAASGGGIGGSVTTPIKLSGSFGVKENVNSEGLGNNIELDGGILIPAGFTGTKAIGVSGIDGDVVASGGSGYALQPSDNEAFFADDPMMETSLKSESNQIVLRIAPAEVQLDEVYLDGISGSNANDGKTKDTAVKTFGQAKALLKNDGTIYIVDMVTVTGKENWNLADRGHARILRHESYIGEEPGDEHGHDYINGPLIEVNGKNADLTMSDMTIDGQSIPAVTGSVVVKQGSLTINKGVVLQKADAENHNGGGLYIYKDGTAVINGAVIKDNKTVGYGGGIFNDGTLTLNEAEITDNTAGYKAGGILNNGVLSLGGTVIVKDNVRQEGEKTHPANLVFASGKYATVTGTLSEDSSIGVDSYAKPANIMRADTWNHPALGPMISYQPTEADLAKLSLDDDGGKYALELKNTNINIVLTASAEPGAVYLDPSEGNDDNDGSADDRAVRTLEKALALAKETDHPKIYLMNTIRAEKEQTIDGQNVEIMRHFSFLGDMVTVFGGELTLKNVVLDGGSEQGAAADGSVVNVAKNGTLTVAEGTEIRNNTTTSAGGGIHNEGTAVMEGGKIENCETSNRSGGGGVFVASNAAFRLEGGTITGCKAFSGGGIETEGSLIITDGTISDNTVRGGGGGVHLFGEGTKATMVMSGGVIEKNSSAEYYGGGIFLWGGSLDITGGTVRENTAVENAGIHGVSEVKLSGSVRITGNKNAEGKDSNLCVVDVDEAANSYTTKTVYQTGALTKDAIIAVSGSGKVSEGEGYTITGEDRDRYVSDEGLSPVLKENAVYMQEASSGGGSSGGGTEEPVEPGPAPDDHDANCPSKAFDDLDTSLWYHEGTDFVIENKMMNGVSDTKFAPNDTTTRAMIVTILWRQEGEPDAEASSFTDVEADSWYEAAVNWAAENKIVNGMSETSFAPMDKITREQLAAILYRYAEAKGADVSAKADLSSFADVSSVSDWAEDALGWAVKTGLMKGVTETTLQPQGNATRAQAAVLMQRFCEIILK